MEPKQRSARNVMTRWMQTYSGIKFDLDNPTVEMINIVDIAHHLALINRFNGATSWPYSVAQHSVEVSRKIPCLEALLHDAHEAYIGDIITPVKQTLYDHDDDRLNELVKEIDRVIRDKFNLKDFSNIDGLHEADLRMCLTERDQLMAEPPADWNMRELKAYDDIVLIPLRWQCVEDLFLHKFKELSK